MADPLLDQVPRTIVVVPGPWENLDALFSRLTRAESGRYIAAAPPEDEATDLTPNMVALMDQATKWCAVCELQAHQPGLERQLLTMGFGRISRKQAQLAAGHRTLLIMTADGGSSDTARAMMDAAAAAVNVGGMAVIVESSGIAHAPNHWLDLASDKSHGGIYWGYTATIGPKNGRTVYTCGLHNLGLRDGITDLFGDPQEAAFVMHNFLGYVHQSGVPVADGDAFGDDNGDCHFQALHEPCTLYPPQDTFFNPYGMWRIVRLPEARKKDLKVISSPPPPGPPPSAYGMDWPPRSMV